MSTLEASMWILRKQAFYFWKINQSSKHFSSMVCKWVKSLNYKVCCLCYYYNTILRGFNESDLRQRPMQEDNLHLQLK